MKASLFIVLLVGLFLPIFPLSIGFNFILKKIRSPLLKIAVLVSWPLIGLTLFFQLDVQPPDWLASWVLGISVFTSMLYAFRLLAQRGINTWTGYLATSIWSLFWIPLLLLEHNPKTLITYVVGFGIPLTIISLLANIFKQRFGIAYTNLHGGIASSMPRFSILLIIAIFATIATPVFPSFFIMVGFITKVLSTDYPSIVLMLVFIWLIWSWAGIRIIQGLLVGPANQQNYVEDLHKGLAWSIGAILTFLAFAGLFITGGFI